MINKTIQLIEPQLELAQTLIQILNSFGYQVEHCVSGAAALTQVAPGITIVSANISDLDVLDWIKQYQQLNHKKPAQFNALVVMVNQHQSQLASDAIQQGAIDYLLAPFAALQVQALLNRLAALAQASRMMVAQSWRSKQTLQMALRAANTDASVLITGESGVGKEVLARYIHQSSARADKPFIAVNCAAIPESMLEAMLFGHVKGAFTGAVTSQTGKFEEAQGGTIFLDEIAEMAPAVQAKLLRILQEREVEKLGSHKTIKLNIRVITATNKVLRQQVEQGLFRQDLYYRLDVLPLHILPLRERREDILPLSQFFIEKYNDAMACQLSPKVRQILLNYSWPGNIRELENVIQRAMIMRHGELISEFDLMLPQAELAAINVNQELPIAEVNAVSNSRLIAKEEVGHTAVKKLAEFEYVIETLKRFRGNRVQTALQLGITTRALRYKTAAMRQQGIDLDSLIN